MQKEEEGLPVGLGEGENADNHLWDNQDDENKGKEEDWSQSRNIFLHLLI